MAEPQHIFEGPDTFADAEEAKAIPLLPADESSNLLLRAARKTPFIATLKEQNELFRRYFKEGDKAAYNRIIVGHVRLAFYETRHFQNYCVPEEILKGAAVEHLMEAIERFDPSRGGRFSTYATSYINAELKNFIGNYHGLPKTQYTRTMFLTLRGVKNTLREKHPGIHTHELNRLLLDHYNKLLGHHVKIKMKHIDFVEAKIANMYLSLNNKVGNDADAAESIDFVASSDQTPEEHLESSQDSAFNRAFLNSVMADMTQQKREIVEYMYMGDADVTIKDAATHFNIPYHITQNLHKEIMEAFKSSAQNLNEKTFDYKEFESIPTAELFELATPSDEEAYETAKEVLTPKDFFIFSSIHLHEQWDAISLVDIAEALSITVKVARETLMRSTQKVISEMSPGFADEKFIDKINRNLAFHKGRSIGTLPFVESHVDLSSPEKTEIYEKAWEILSPSDLYIFLAYKMYSPHLRKSTTHLASECDMTPDNVRKSLKDSTALIKSVIRKSLRDDSTFLHEPPKTGRSPKQNLSNDNIPTIDTNMIDLSTEERKNIYTAAQRDLTPYRFYALCLYCLAFEDQRIWAKEIAEKIGQSQAGVNKAIESAKNILLKKLPPDPAYKAILDAVPSRVGRNKSVGFKNIPTPDKNMIDFSDDDTLIIYDHARKALSDYAFYIFTVHRLYAENQRLTKHEIAQKLIDANPAADMPDKKNLAERVYAIIKDSTHTVQKTAPEKVRDSLIFSQKNLAKKDFAISMQSYPAVDKICLSLATPAHRTIYEAASKTLNPFQLYVFLMHRMARTPRLKTLREISEFLDKPLSQVYTALNTGQKKLVNALPEDLKESPILLQCAPDQKHHRKTSQSGPAP